LDPLVNSISLAGLNITIPDLQIIIGFFILIILLIVSALISGTEVAFSTLKAEDIEVMKNDQSKKSEATLKLYNNPQKILSTLLVLNIIINIAIISLAFYLSSRLFDFSLKPQLGFFLNFIAITILILLFGEILPKVYASQNKYDTVRLMAYPLSWLQILLAPVTSVLIFASSFVRKKSTVKGPDIDMNVLSDAFELTSDNNEDEKILKGIVNFRNITVNAIMCPRIDVTAIDIKLGFDKIIPLIVDSGFSRIPVYAGSFDTVRGILYAKDVLPYTNYPATFKWQTLVRPPYFVPDTKRINELLREFQTKRIHMAVVIDEYGGTSGIVTLEDILEEIVGEITDEGDEDEVLFRKIDDHSYVFEGRVLLNDFCKILELDENIFDDVRGESETLAGLIIELTEEIPQKDQVIEYERFTFKIESADKRRIKQILVEIDDDV
jgi:putative hemolysin